MTRGKTWHTSEPFAEAGTGEAAIVECWDGRSGVQLAHALARGSAANSPASGRERGWGGDLPALADS